MKVEFERGFEKGNRLNYAVEREKTIPGRGKDYCKKVLMREPAYLRNSKKEASVASWKTLSRKKHCRT